MNGRGMDLGPVLGVIDGEAAEALLAREGSPSSVCNGFPHGIGGVEVRGDLFGSVETALELVHRIALRCPVLFTLRLEGHGGRWTDDGAARVEIYERAIEAGACWVDAELGSETAGLLSAHGLPIVVSEHDFDGFPSERELARVTGALEESGAGVIKLVPTARTLGDAIRMLEWVEDAPPGGPRRVGFAMGERGLVSRILCVSRGSPWTYGALGGAVAPGQPSAEDLVGLYRVAHFGARPAVFGVVGRPVAHSLSPVLHNHALDRHRVDAVYVPLLLDRLDELEPAWERLNLRGVSVTIPFKEDAFRRADRLDERARRAGAVNTLVLDGELRPGERPRLAGYNTDFDGVLGPLRRRGVELAGLEVAVIGNGGAARGAVRALEEAGARPTLAYRNAERGEPVARDLGVPGLLIPELDVAAYGVVVNATPVGLEPGDASPLPEATWRAGQIAFDMIYDPPQTAFLQAAGDAGATTIPGGEMLVEQGLVQFELFTGSKPDRESFEASLAEALAERR